MNFNRKDVVTGLIVILLIIGGAYLYRYLKKPRTQTPTPSPASFEFRKDLEDSFKLDIPDNVNSIELKDISGGDGRGIATDKEILVDANDPEAGYFYQAWLENSGKLIPLTKLQIAKGGWIANYDRTKYPEYKKLIISLEKVNDNKIEKILLEGSF